MNHPLLYKKIAVIGAAGKMGKGIALLLLQEMARALAESTGAISHQHASLLLIDVHEDGLASLASYLREQLPKYAEKHIMLLRGYFENNADLISNKEIIDYFLAKSMELIRLSTAVEEAKNVSLCFEAIIEDVAAKVELFSKLDVLSKHKMLFFSNTSAIPIAVLDEQANLQGRIIGFHFYNPPPVQTLLEMVPLAKAPSALTEMASVIAKKLGKHTIYAHDVAGFIGNGYLLREVVVAVNIVQQLLQQGYTLAQAVGMVDYASGEFLLRPMGIFQLVEYVGFELLLHIGHIMNTYLPQPIYAENFISALKQYRPYFSQKQDLKELLGPLPMGHVSWKILAREKHAKNKIESYLRQLKQAHTKGAEIAQMLLIETAHIAQKLVQEQVATSLHDVDVVLKEGFYHLYGAVEYERL